MRPAARALVGAVAFVLPAIFVYEVLGVAWPAHHDLSDIGTGLMRMVLALVAGLAGLVVGLLLTRTDRR